jgi:hypothetical protein
VQVADWFTSGDLVVDWSFRIDTLTVVMLVVVNTVSALVHLYSIGYMHEDPHRPRFFAYLSLFTFAMLMLVTADNLVQMFFGWEGVGLASYLLIGFWYEKPAANAAAMKAFIVNRVGDLGFALGIFLVFVLFGTVTLDGIFARVPEFATASFRFLGAEWHALTLASLLLFMGAMGKSAQFLLHTWLPDAMEGPTPVSALIHACYDGDGRRLHGRSAIADLRGSSQRSGRGDGRGRHHGAVRGDGRTCSKRHQAGHRLLDLLATRLHVRGARSGRLRGGHLPPVHPRLFQGVAVPRRRLRHPRDASRAGHAQHGRASPVDSVHGRHDDHRDPGADRLPGHGRLLL